MFAANQAKDKGNRLFKERKLVEALKFYKDAEKLDPQSPVYPSNSSAALYELGDYKSSAESVLRSWSLGPTENLISRLSTRLAKCLVQGFQNGTINPSFIEQNEDAIKELQSRSSTENVDAAQAWNAWRNIRKEMVYRTELVREAKVALAKLPIYKSMHEPESLYFVFGIEPVVSLPNGFGPDNDDALNLRTLPKDILPELSFMLAGIGDGRHGFGTIIGLAEQYKNLNATRQKSFKAHIAINDIHFGIVARNLMFYLILDELMADDLDPMTRIEIQATFFYMYAGWIVPTYVHNRFVKLCQKAETLLTADPVFLPSCMGSSIQPILEVLNFWSTDTSKKTSDVLDHLKYGSAAEHIQSLMNAGIMGVREAMQSQRADAERSLKHMPDDVLRTLGVNMRWRETSLSDLRRKLIQEKDDVVDMLLMAQFDKNVDLGLLPEAEWFRRTLAFLPPAELMDRHNGFEYYHISIGAIGQKGKADDAKFKKIKIITAKTWKPNITIFVECIGLNSRAEPDGRCVDMSLDSFGSIQEIARFNEKNALKETNRSRKMASPAFSYVVTFLDAAVLAAKAMKDRLQIEFIGGEIYSVFTKMSLGVDRRPASFPRKFTRIWLSNIPDYRHGSLNTIAYALPVLQDGIDGSGVTANCQFNSPTWSSDEEYCYNYTLLHPRDLERYLGIRTVNSKAVQDSLTLANIPRPLSLSSLISREELHSWLGRLLISLLYSGTAQPRPNTVKLPDNLVAFVKLLYELHAIGYPSHWISDFLHAVLNRTLLVDQPVYREQTPRPVSQLFERVAPYHARFDPWYAELEMILALTWYCLPFAVHLPSGLPLNTDEIGLFKAKPIVNMQFMSMLSFPRNDNVFCLLLYHPSESGIGTSSITVQSLLSDLPSIIEGKSRPPPGTFCIFTTLEFLDLNISEVRWKMNKKLAARMKREQWLAILWRLDFHTPVTQPCRATTWSAVE